MSNRETFVVRCELVCANCKTAGPCINAAGRMLPVDELQAMATAAHWVFAHDEAFCSYWCRDVFEPKQKVLGKT